MLMLARLFAWYLVIGLITGSLAEAAERPVLDLWPAAAGENDPPRELHRDPPDGVARLTDVSRPQITVYRPDEPTGAAVLVCPGGGYKILAYEHEGTQVCEFFNRHGVTAILLQYRVPAPRELPLQDAQRALGLIHRHADAWGIDRSRIGMLGFSAGGHLTLMTCLRGGEQTYQTDPAIDIERPVPAFATLVYPAYLVERGSEGPLVEEIALPEEMPPLCLIHAADDPWTSSGSALLAIECRKRKVPCELHVYAKGGHGFGMKRTGLPVDSWPDRVIEWMGSLGLLEPMEAASR
jgi:acetyl esterase/lipase